MKLAVVARLALVLVALSALQCASARILIRPTPTTAQELYDQSMEDLEDGLYPEALKGFSELKSKYPYTKFAALADLRTADTHLRRGKHIEAVDAYRNFLKFHPNHEEAPYAMLQIGEAYFSQIPEDWFFMPPSAEKEQANVKLALTGFQDMVARYPQSKAAETARERIKDCQRKLAEHELYVADFYFSREVFRAAAGRAETILNTYSNLGYDEQALWIAGWSRYQTGELEKAVEHLQRLRAEFPKSGKASAAGDILAEIQPKIPTAKKEEPGAEG